MEYDYHDFMCPICQKICVDPVRFKIIKNTDNFQFTIRFCLKNWSMCNDVYCRSCALNFLYHCQEEGKEMHRLKCPMCRQNIMLSTDMDSYLDCMVEDTRFRNQCHRIIEETVDKFECNYSCGFQCSNFNELLEHERNNCRRSFLECPSSTCKKIFRISDKDKHVEDCQHLKQKCVFCNRSFYPKDQLDHLRNYHKIIFHDNLENALENLFSAGNFVYVSSQAQ